MTPGQEAAPLSAGEHRLLREIAQELTRTDPGLAAGPGTAPPEPARPARVVFAAYAFGSCATVGALAEAVGPLVALVAGATLAVVGAALGGAITGSAPRGHPRDHPAPRRRWWRRHR